ncbi:MAG: SPOR domain-containing protein [Saprospiraceae bacterium]|nr:SPOR domain-containing protein [Saprospiraceae bacterium]
MSRLDYVTIGIVIAILAILGFLVFKVMDLVNEDDSVQSEQTEQTVADLQNYEPEEEDTYTYDDEGDIIKEDIETALPATDVDLDDDELGGYDEIADEPIDEYAADEAKEESIDDKTTSSTPASYDDEYADESSTGVAEGEYMVIAGSYRIKANADNAARDLRKKGYANAATGLFNKGAYANVIVDRFSSIDRAKELAKELKAKGIEAYVQKKVGE